MKPESRHSARVPITCSEQWISQVDTWRFANRISSRAQAIRMLATEGMKTKGSVETAISPSPEHNGNPAKETINELGTQ